MSEKGIRGRCMRTQVWALLAEGKMQAERTGSQREYNSLWVSLEFLSLRSTEPCLLLSNWVCLEGCRFWYNLKSNACHDDASLTLLSGSSLGIRTE